MSGVVETTGGRITGLRRQGISVYLGIPYAGSVRGDARFDYPRQVRPWKGIREAFRQGPPAPQNPPHRLFASRWLGLVQGAPGEDCLSVNVFTPACDTARRPVMVWIHGGAFVFGSGGTPLYAGDSLARLGNVVVVSLNYRLGALGFLYLNEFSDRFASNLGLHDQIAALLWVSENIAAFGGDPSNVTLFGESAGAMCAAALFAAPKAKSLFARVILQSGAAHHVSNRQHALHIAKAFLAEVNIAPRDVGLLNVIPWPVLCRAQRNIARKLSWKRGQLPWQPVIDGDLLPLHPEVAVGAGVSEGKDLLIGTNSDEWKLFSVGNRRLRALTFSELKTRLESSLTRFPDCQALVEEVFDLYCAELRSGGNGPFEVWCAFQRDRVFRSPADRFAVAQSGHDGGTYQYLFDWVCPFASQILGACHGLELPFVFGALNRPALLPFFGIFPGARRLSRTMQRAWVAFARTGSPNDSELEFWPPYDPSESLTMQLAATTAVRPMPNKASLRFHARLAARETMM